MTTNSNTNPVKCDFFTFHKTKGGYDTVPLNFASAYDASPSRTFIGVDNNISVKSDYNRSDFEYFRNQSNSDNPIKTMQVSNEAYKKVGIVKQVIDMMSEFACQGVRLQHRNAKHERFFNKWFETVSGQFVSVNFVNTLLRLGSAPIKTTTTSISIPEEDGMSRTTAGLEYEKMPKVRVTSREIPIRYTIIAPWTLEVIGGELALFIGKPEYALKIPGGVRSEINKLKKLNQVKTNQLITEIEETIGKTEKYYYLDPNKFQVYHYKKDDWEVWGRSLIAPIIDDLVMYERLRLADMSALDGAISNIRHWKVGIIDDKNLANSILPNAEGIAKIRDVIANNVGGGTMDFVTGPEIEFKESETKVHEFLGSEKYETVLNAIYDGLGLPIPLRSNTGGGNATNNFVSLKTLVERMQYLRHILIDFWTKEIKKVQLAMGYKYPAHLVFDELILSDEATHKDVLMQLVDRQIITEDDMREYMGYIPEITKHRAKKEHDNRQKNKLPPKVSPYHQDVNADVDYNKILLQNGDITPSQIGIELEDKLPGEKTRQEMTLEQKTKQAKMVSSKLKKAGGRPAGKVETKQRKPKPKTTIQTKGYSELVLWAEKAFSHINTYISSALLKEFNKANLRQFTVEENNLAENKKFAIFCSLEPFQDIDDEILSEIASENPQVDRDIDNRGKSISAGSERLEDIRKGRILAYVEQKL